jgi:Protein of unknown function (DUF2510)/Protein of unknown function (DUF732)
VIESAGWHPDPSRRHEYRYWNGWLWTDFVADRGVVTVDPPTAAEEASRSGEPTWVVVLALILFFPIGLWLVWREPWRPSVKIGTTAVVVILLLGGAVASSIAAHDQSKTATTGSAVERPAPRTVPTTTAPSAPTTGTRAFLHAVRDPRSGPLAADSDASLLDLGRLGCNALNTGLPASLLSSSMHTHEPDITLAQARYFVGTIRLLCPRR